MVTNPYGTPCAKYKAHKVANRQPRLSDNVMGRALGLDMRWAIYAIDAAATGIALISRTANHA
jgi:hypothetical protein